MKARRMKESVVQRHVIEVLKLRRDIVAWRTNAGAAKMAGAGGRIRPVFFGKKGGGDITGLIKPWGVHLEIECKRPGGKQTVHQIAHEHNVRACGGVYLLVDSIDDFRRKLDEALTELNARFAFTVPREETLRTLEEVFGDDE